MQNDYGETRQTSAQQQNPGTFPAEGSTLEAKVGASGKSHNQTTSG